MDLLGTITGLIGPQSPWFSRGIPGLITVTVPSIIEFTAGEELSRDNGFGKDENLVFDRHFTFKTEEAEGKRGLKEARMLRNGSPGRDGAAELAGG